MRVSALNRKLLRDLWAMRGQAVAIALVMAAGVAMFVAYQANYTSLEGTRRAYYEQQRFADVFELLVRAPDRLRPLIEALPGVEDVETRIASDVILDVPGLDAPASGRLISIPAAGRPVLNDLHLRRGRWVSRDRPDEVIASEAFVEANRFEIGDRFGALINGRRRDLTIVGVALSPEYVYSIRPGELVPDSRRYGIFWMERTALAAAFDMTGAFNDVSLTLARGAVPDQVVADLERLLEPYGGRGAFPRALQYSNWTLENELGQLRSMAVMIPAIFLLVAAFVLNVALTRALALQRPQLAALKALGYTNAELAWHYIKWGLGIALLGAVLGVLAGSWMGAAMLGLYNDYFKFPSLAFDVPPAVILAAMAVALGASFLGVVSAVRRAVRISPAEAMRPEVPARFRRSAFETPWLRRHWSTTLRMIVRNLERQPVRASTTIVGIGFGVALLVVGFSLLGSMDRLVVMQFSEAERQDATVAFVLPVSASARYGLQRLPGVLRVEPQRSVPARLRAGPRSRTLSLTGVPDAPDLRRPMDDQGRVIPAPGGGIVLSSMLGRRLGVTAGDSLEVEVLEGAQPRRRMLVTRLVDDTFGVSAYVDLDDLHALLREADLLSGAALLLDGSLEASFSEAVKGVPAIAGVGIKRLVLENFRRMLAENMGITLTFNVLFASVIAFGVVYNAARVSLSERSRELASLRVLGFTRAEISFILLGELALLTLLALPTGAAIGYGLTMLLVQSFESELFRFPLVMSTQVVAWASLVVITASLVSGLVVRHQLDHLDLVGVLKLRE